MSRRIGFLSLLAFVVGGLVWWSALPDPLRGSSYQDSKTQPAADPDHGKHDHGPAHHEQSDHEKVHVGHADHSHADHPAPKPPPGRAEGDFCLDVSSPAEQKVRTALKAARGVDIEFIDTPLKDAMDFLAESHKITIIVDEQSLQEEGVAIDEPINRTLSGIKLESTLKIMLEPLGLTYMIEDEVLKITPQVHADKKRFTRVYQTGYLTQIGVEPDALSQTIQAVIAPASWGYAAMRVASDPAAKKVISLQQGTAGGAAILGSGTLVRNVQFRTDSKPDPKPPEPNAIHVLGDMLVISAPQSIHKKVDALLIQLDRRWELEHGKN